MLLLSTIATTDYRMAVKIQRNKSVMFYALGFPGRMRYLSALRSNLTKRAF